MAENDPNDPNPEPPPLIRTETKTDEQMAADAERELQLWDAEEQSKKLQPMFVNRAFVKIESRMLRVSFGERIGEEDVYRSAIIMTPEDAYAFGQLLMSQGSAAYGAALDHYRQLLADLAKIEEPHG